MSMRLDKVKTELIIAWEEAVIQNYFQWAKDKKRVLHTWTNFWTEFRRATPYTMGHWDAVTQPLKWIGLAILIL